MSRTQNERCKKNDSGKEEDVGSKKHTVLVEKVEQNTKVNLPNLNLVRLVTTHLKVWKLMNG